METAGSGPGEPSPLEAAGSPDDRLFLIKGMVSLCWNGSSRSHSALRALVLSFTPNSACWPHTSPGQVSLGRGGHI